MVQLGGGEHGCNEGWPWFGGSILVRGPVEVKEPVGAERLVSALFLFWVWHLFWTLVPGRVPAAKNDSEYGSHNSAYDAQII